MADGNWVYAALRQCSTMPMATKAGHRRKMPISICQRVDAGGKELSPVRTCLLPRGILERDTTTSW